MIWMETFCFHCSVRLGVIVAAIVAMIQVLIAALCFIISGVSLLHHLVDFVEQDEDYKKQKFMRTLLDWLSKKPEEFMAFVYVAIGLHMVNCCLAIYGAFKLKRWYVVPFVITEFIRFIILMTLHIVGMIILKKLINLGLLIAATLVGSCGIFYVGYNWASSVALFQIIGLIHTEKYRALYGDDPLVPYTHSGDTQYPHGNTKSDSIENVKVFSTPNYDDVRRAKERNLLNKNERNHGDIISVIPAGGFGYDDMEYRNFHLNELIAPNMRH